MSLAPECLDKGAVWEGETVGKEIKMAGMDVYISEPAGPTTKAALFIADIHGWAPKNPRIIADEFAKKGYLSVLPDFFFGDPILPTFTPQDRERWQGAHGPSKVPEKLKLIDDVLAALKADYGITKVGVEGFCWGGFYAAELAVSGKVDVAVITHGSRVTTKQVQELTKPTSFLCAEIDNQIPEPLRKEFSEILAKKDFPCELKTYPGVSHGFSVRGDKTNPDIAEKAADALLSAIAFMDAHITEE